MTDCKDIKYCSLELLKFVKNKKSVVKADEAKITILFEKYIDKLIFNISAICALICLKIGLAKVYEKHMVYLLEYVDKLCLPKNKKSGSASASRHRRGSMNGGSVFNTAAFYGNVESAYKRENEGSDIMNIDFENNIARPALYQVNMGGGGKAHPKTFSCNKLNVIINRKITKVFRHYNIKVKKASIKMLNSKFNEILNMLIVKLHKIKGNITLSKTKVVFKKYKMMKNDI
jgi:hypothetical protein